ncbi:hypothetical protein O181_040853 [Austropuccinia psidii MF-1]|uniref:Integrase zinc-binding domain-containing protein n=1 Tax=Austropuccinia psidii MF-1 TaxID=1389203 RepID=A0A9Q3DG91_9BASI|nr:hypothetical protein [Austropuccinia psidii MF-1]
MSLTDRTLIDTILNEFHDNVLSGHLSEDRTLERVKARSWWQNWRKYVAEYCKTCDRCQKANRATGKKFGMMIQIEEPKSPFEISHMDWVTALPPGGDKSFKSCLVLFDRYKEGMIQTLEDIIRRFGAYGLEFKDSDGFGHYWCILIPAIEPAYKTSIHYSTGKKPEMLEKRFNTRIPYENLKKDLVDIHPTESSFFNRKNFQNNA